MGKCSKCGKKIEYNSFVVVNGVVYHRECAPKETLMVVIDEAKNIDFSELAKELSKIPGTIISTPECDINNKIAEERDINNKIAEERDINNKIAKPKKRKKSKKE